MTENIEVAAQQIRGLAAKEIGLLQQQAAKIAEAGAAEEAAGRAFLENDPGGDHLDRALRLQAEARLAWASSPAGRSACRPYSSASPLRSRSIASAPPRRVAMPKRLSARPHRCWNN